MDIRFPCPPSEICAAALNTLVMRARKRWGPARNLARPLAHLSGMSMRLRELAT